MCTKAVYAALAVALIVAGLAQADPWPDYSSHRDYVGYAEILPVNSSNTTWEYYISIVSGASEPGHGSIIGIKALAVYPNAGNVEEALSGWTGDSAYVRQNWDNNGGWHTQEGAFGYLTGGQPYYITRGQTGELIGAAAFPTSYMPPEQRFLVHVVCSDDYTYWARPTIIPEPGGLLILASGIVPLVRLAVRRRQNL